MKKYLIFASCLLFFSTWLMFHTLSYRSQTGQILVGGKYYSDFGNALPLVRSFSFGNNPSWQHPLFPNEPSRYHLLFYFLAGQLEKADLRLDYALNIPSVLGFFFLCLLIWALAFRLFHRHSVALLSVIFFLFNSSFSWLDFINKYGFSISALKSLSHFPSFGPWNGSQISAFWNLNIYTNQRHLALSFAVVLAIIYIVYTSHRHLVFLLGPLLGFLLLSHQAAFSIAVLFACWQFIFSPVKSKIIISLVGFLPFLFFYLRSTQPPSFPIFHPVFLYNGPLQFWPIAKYWFLNFGLHLLLIPLGFFFSPKRAQMLIFPLLVLFLLPNLFQFSPDMINNHKFFNFFLILGGMFTANLLLRFRHLLLLIPLLILGGITDFFPIKNDSYLFINDYPANPDVKFLVDNTAPDSVVLNSFWFYHPASIAGRRIFQGYPYFTWSYGYDQVTRESQALSIYRAADKPTACRLLQLYHIDYVELNPHPEAFLQPNLFLWQNDFTPVYTNPSSGLSIYSVLQNCPGSISFAVNPLVIFIAV